MKKYLRKIHLSIYGRNDSWPDITYERYQNKFIRSIYSMALTISDEDSLFIINQHSYYNGCGAWKKTHKNVQNEMFIGNSILFDISGMC